jgi:hypothetical protein
VSIRLLSDAQIPLASTSSSTMSLFSGHKRTRTNSLNSSPNSSPPSYISSPSSPPSYRSNHPYEAASVRTNHPHETASFRTHHPPETASVQTHHPYETASVRTWPLAETLRPWHSSISLWPPAAASVEAFSVFDSNLMVESPPSTASDKSPSTPVPTASSGQSQVLHPKFFGRRLVPVSPLINNHNNRLQYITPCSQRPVPFGAGDLWIGKIHTWVGLTRCSFHRPTLWDLSSPAYAKLKELRRMDLLNCLNPPLVPAHWIEPSEWPF